MILSKIDSALLKHPYFKNMDSSQRIAIYNKVYSYIFRIRDEITLINRVAYSSDKAYQLEVYHSKEINLSAHKDVDSLLNKHFFLQNLTNDQKILVYTIAAHKLNIYRTLSGNQEYFFSTLRPDIIIRTPIYYAPVLAIRRKILHATNYFKRYFPSVSVRNKIFPSFINSKIWIPLLSVTKKIYGANNIVKRYIPALQVTGIIIVQEINSLLNTFIPVLSVSTKINSSNYLSDILTPDLNVSTNIIFETDYSESYLYQPTLTVTAQITK